MKNPDNILSYFARQKKNLAFVTVTGIFYNTGMVAGPYFEGQLAQCLCDILGAEKTAADMIKLAAAYVLVIAFVQFMRYLKRLYVRKFANEINLSMKENIYHSLLSMTKKQMDTENIGATLTKRLSDVEACAEGMRKFTTEIFDTGVVLVAYLCMLLYYDWRLTLISVCFVPVAYFIAERLKTTVTRDVAQSKESAGRLNRESLERIANSTMYRVYGEETNRNNAYTETLCDYRNKSIKANILVSSMQPVYHIITMMGAISILYFGAKNVLGTGWADWNIAAFSTFLACFAKLATKSSKSAKLFNAVQKASVSWKRIKPYFREETEFPTEDIKDVDTVEFRDVSFGYDGNDILEDVSFTAEKGQIIAITGEIASGKSTLGRLLLGEDDYRGEILIDGILLKDYKGQFLGYLGHQNELFSDSIRENVTFDSENEPDLALRQVRIDDEIKEFENGLMTRIGNKGIRLSGGQQRRIALARVFFNRMPVMVLDDPFAALDKNTEKEIFEEIRDKYKDCIVFIISHRLAIFPYCDKVLWIDNGHVTQRNHETLMRGNEKYRNLVSIQAEA